MARGKSFDQETVLQEFCQVFSEKGYELTSLDDLVLTSGLLRGSLYNAFGSKEKMFLLALDYALKTPNHPQQGRLILVAFYELAARSEKTKDRLRVWIQDNPNIDLEVFLGNEVLKRSQLFKEEVENEE